MKLHYGHGIWGAIVGNTDYQFSNFREFVSFVWHNL